MNSSILKSVSKPGRYTGGEFGQIIKDKASVKARWAFCFPDTYEIGMSNLGMKIICVVIAWLQPYDKSNRCNDDKYSEYKLLPSEFAF